MEEKLVDVKNYDHNYYGEKLIGIERLSRIESLRNYEINIRFLHLGCIVSVGCKEIAFTSIEKAMQEVNEYVANPKLLLDKYNKLFNEQQ
jgi:hypothetical protein